MTPRLAGFGLIPFCLVSGAAWAEPPPLQFPVACEIGQTCVVQHYVDRDPGPGAKDFRCGTLTYDGHNGTDIRLPTLAAQQAGVDVLAAAPGRVLRTRDTMADVPRAPAGAASAGAPTPDADDVAGRECGNGLVIAHEGGLETQYCHMAKGSLRVKAGDTVAAGAPLGRIGLSGATEFPHLHFTVRQGPKILDPFAPDQGAPASGPGTPGPASGTPAPGTPAPGTPASCGAGRSLWAPAVEARLAYHAGEVLNHGFAPGPVTMADVEAGAGIRPPPGDAPALVAFVRAIGLKAGDVQRLTVTAPDGRPFADTTAAPLDRNKAQTLLFAGKKRPGPGWPPGRYTALYTVTRDGRPALEQRFELSRP